MDDGIGDTLALLDAMSGARAHRFSAEPVEGSTDIVQKIPELWLEDFNEFRF